MRDCKKNNRKMYYSLYSDEIPILDSEGNDTLETKVGYLAPVEFHASLSSGKATAEESPFGTNVIYDRIINTFDKTIPIDENAIIWVHNVPTYNDDNSVNSDSADYKVSAKPLDGLDSIRIAIAYKG